MYSVEFEGVRVREAFKRMLSSFNRCLFIDRKGELLGVIIISKKRGGVCPEIVESLEDYTGGPKRGRCAKTGD